MTARGIDLPVRDETPGRLLRYSPPMTDLKHRIKIFVYCFEQGVPRYLLVRSSRGVNPTWGTLDGPIGFDEQIESAVRREVHEDVGLERPEGLIDLQMPALWTLGDEEVVEWPYGFRAPRHETDLILNPRWSEFRWADFSEAYARFQLDLDRAAVTRLHTLINAA